MINVAHSLFWYIFSLDKLLLSSKKLCIFIWVVIPLLMRNSWNTSWKLTYQKAKFLLNTVERYHRTDNTFLVTSVEMKS